MSEDRLPSLANLPHRIRAGLANWPAGYRQWREDLRQDPALLWQTPAVRIVLWIVLGIILVSGLYWAIATFTPSGTDSLFVEPTPLATLYVACTNPDCRAHYNTKQPMDFDSWPLKCEQCGSESVYRAKLCSVCRRWFATAPGQPTGCPFCATRHKAEQTPETIDSDKPTNIDDEEDPWG